jgi:hypothetical protein
LNYNRAVAERFGESIEPHPVGVCDDFAGIFPPGQFAEFVLPYWDQTYRRQCATERTSHN